MAPRLDIYRTTDGGVEPLRLKAGTNRLRVLPGRTFRLIADGREIDPDSVRVLQIENDLIIEGIETEAGEEPATVVLENYYRVCSATDPCTVSVGSEAAPVTLVDVSNKPIGALSDGTMVLRDTGFQAPATTSESDFPVRPVLYGLGGAAVLGLALGSGGGGGDGQADPNAVPLALKSATTFNNRFPTISGTAQPGTQVSLRIDTDGDQLENVTYTTTADANGNWSVNLQTATPASGALPATGLSDSNGLEISGVLNGVQGAPLALITLTFDDTPPAQAVLNPIAEDNIITDAEKAAGVTVSGTAEANGTVEITLGTLTKLVAVDAAGNWATALAADEVPATDGQYELRAIAIDAAGNRGPAATSNVTVNATGTAPAIGIVAGNDIVNAAEAAQPINIQGTAAPGATVTLTWGTFSGTATANAQGIWAIAATAPSTDGNSQISVTTSAGSATATRTVMVDRTAPAAATGITVDDGTTITYAEAQDGVKISGRADAGSTVTVTWGSTTQTATAASNGQWTVSFEPSQLPNVADGQTLASSFSVQVTDAAGNAGPTTNTSVTLEGKPAAANTPTITAIAQDNIVNSAEASGGIEVSGSADANARISVSIDGGPAKTTTANASGQWNISELTVPSGDGTKTVTVVATNAAGGTANATQSITVDRTAPSISNLSVPDGPEITQAEAADGVVVTGTTEAGATVTATWGSATATGTADGSGAWSITFTAGQVPQVPTGGSASSTISVIATDAAGNAGTASTQSVTVSGAPATTEPPTTPPSTDTGAGGGNTEDTTGGTTGGTTGTTTGTGSSTDTPGSTPADGSNTQATGAASGTGTGAAAESGSGTTTTAAIDANGAAETGAAPGPETPAAGTTAGGTGSASTSSASTGSTAAAGTPPPDGTSTTAEAGGSSAASGATSTPGSTTGSITTSSLTQKSTLSLSDLVNTESYGSSSGSPSGSGTAVPSSTGSNLDNLLSSNNPWETQTTL
ncbi:MAG: Ig-like domain-containing protein [Lautropia sp.]|nr:Ig-like domain-containing protein [Lautropia sp.]